MIGKTISHYKILEEIGCGGMGVVYKAEDTKLGRTVALKFLPPKLTGDEAAKARFVHEAQAASALDHPNICTIYEIDEAQSNQMFIAMAFYEGETLDKKIERGPLDLEEVIDTAIQITDGLALAHESGIVHRDIKPANIMITSRSEVKVVDFGLSKLAGKTRLTKEGISLGTVDFMSPEQVRGEDVDRRTDIWSLGVVLYAMLTGRTPFRGEYEQAVMYSIMNENPKPITAQRAGVPMELERIVGKALEKDPNRRYQRMEELLVDLRNLKDTEFAETAAKLRSGRVRSIRRFYAIASVLLIVGLMIIVGVRIQIGLSPSAVAEENSIAIMQFDNIADPEDSEKISEIVTNLLITDLSESEYVRVLSTQRLDDVRKQLGMEDEKVLDMDAASQVAGKANVRWMLLGSILQVEPKLVITSRLIDMKSGQVEASQRIAGEDNEEIFSLVDRLTVEIKKDLSLPSRARKEADSPVIDVTTSSRDAYRYFLEGYNQLGNLHYAEAAQSFKKALEYDSTFAMAYYGLYWCAWIGEERHHFMDKALEYCGRASKKEEWYIRGQAAMSSGDYDQAIEHFERITDRYPDEKMAYLWKGDCFLNLEQYEEALFSYKEAIELDPLYWASHRIVGSIYNLLGDDEKALESYNKACSVAPDEAAPYISKGHFYSSHGMIDKAIESYEKSLELMPNLHWAWSCLGDRYLCKRDYAKAEDCYRHLASSEESVIRPWGRLLLAFVPLHQGKFIKALEVLDDGLAADRMEQSGGYWNAMKHCCKAKIYIERGNFDLMSDDIGEMGCLLSQARLLIENEDFEGAVELANALEGGDRDEFVGFINRDELLGFIELSKGNPEAAVVLLEKNVERIGQLNFDCCFLLANAYLETGDLSGAVSQLERALSNYGHFHLRSVIWTVKAHYLLGLAYERSGWTNKAIEKYEEFLEIWKDADEGLPEVEDARKRLALLSEQ